MRSLEIPVPAASHTEKVHQRTVRLLGKHVNGGNIHPYHSQLPKHAVGRYEIIYPIAAGGMASVYTGRLSGMAGFERLFAIKVIHPHLAREQSFIEMFLDEARLAGRIHHPNVAEIFEVGEDNGLYYMVGELVIGQDLRRLVEAAKEKGTPLPSPVVANIIAGIARGLHEAHELKDEDGEPSHLVHRDISTQNILISYKGYTKLIDFGVAWARGRLATTKDGSQKGKIGYMPPEQLRGEAIDRRGDIYALGVVLYTVLVGTHPFPYDNEGEQVTKMLAGEFTPPKKASPNIDPFLDRIILKAMAKAPKDRYATARDMGRDLSRFVEEHMSAGDAVKQLADLMQTLFQDKIVEHEEKIREHRRQSHGGMETEHLAGSSAAPEHITRPSRITEVVDDRRRGAIGGQVVDTSPSKIFRSQTGRITVVFAVLAALASIYFFGFHAENAFFSDNQIHPLNPDNGVTAPVGIKPPPAEPTKSESSVSKPSPEASHALTAPQKPTTPTNVPAQQALKEMTSATKPASVAGKPIGATPKIRVDKKSKPESASRKEKRTRKIEKTSATVPTTAVPTVDEVPTEDNTAPDSPPPSDDVSARADESSSLDEKQGAHLDWQKNPFDQDLSNTEQ